MKSPNVSKSCKNPSIAQIFVNWEWCFIAAYIYKFRGETVKLCVELTRKRVKNINVRVKEDGKITISAPPRMKDEYIRDFLEEKLDWILSSQKKLDSLTPLYISKDEEDVQNALTRLSGVLQKIWSVVEGEGIPFPELKLKAMKSRWGSCCPGKRQICLNLALGSLDDHLIEYVVLHELMHFLHPNHGKAFWQAVSRYMPDWKIRRAMLRKYRLVLG